MANKYANLVGTNKIKDEYTKINTGFDRVEADVNKLKTDVTAVNTRVDTIITTPISGEAATQEIVDARVSAVKSKTFATLDARFEETEQDIATHKTDKAAHGGIYHKNLLHNWDFRNPVNQRGQSSYSVGNYAIDRWRTNSPNISVNINSGYITVSNNGDAERHFLQQLEFMVPGDYTASVLLANGDILSGSLNVNDSVARGSGSSSTKNLTDGLRVQIGDFSSKPAFKLIIVPGHSFNIVAVKLELGSVSTLANDPPADYGEQLALCQRYCLSIGIDDGVRAWAVQPNVLHFNLPLPTSMRIVPSLERGSLIVRPINLSSSETGFTFSYLATPRANTLTIRATKTGHGLTDAILYLADNPVFSADL